MSYNSFVPWPYGMSMRTVSATATATNSDEMIVKLASSSISIWLTPAVGRTGRQLVLKNAGSGTFVVRPNSGELIDGLASDTVGVNQSRTYISDGVGWYVI